MTKGRYLVIATRTGHLTVMVNEDWNPHPGEVLMAKLDTIDQAFDWKEDMEARIAVAARHCATCEA
jgi:hypothetical protein